MCRFIRQVPRPTSRWAALRRRSLSRSASVTARCSVMSANEPTTPVIAPSASRVGTTLMSSQRRPLSEVCTPRTWSRCGSPVASATIVGWLSGGISEPSSRTIRQVLSALPRPCMRSSWMPRMRCALSLANTTAPERSWAINPSVIASSAASDRDRSRSPSCRVSASTSRCAATSASMLSISRSFSSKASGLGETAATRPMAASSWTSGTTTEERVLVRRLMSGSVRGSSHPSRHSCGCWVVTASPPSVPVTGISAPAGGALPPTLARATRTSPASCAVSAPSAPSSA